jgi:type I restriction enzyme S subunit
MSFPRYESYKDSGIEWLGEIPVHWRKTRLSEATEILSGNPFDASLFGFEGIPVIRMSDFSNGNVIVSEAKKVSQSSVPNNAMAKSGDILLGLSGSISNFAIVKESDLPIAINQRVAIVRTQNKHGIVSWLLQSKEFLDQISAQLPATTIQNISMGQLRNCKFGIPSGMEEQKVISDFLDRETAKIDALIAEQQCLIELLKEKRQAVISHAVTKGLNPDAPMKDSGIEWLGEVPSHWEVVPIKRMTLVITDGAHISPETEDGVYDFISTKDISESGIDFEGCLKTSATSYEYLVRTGCKPLYGDVLFSKDGTIGRTIVIKEQREFVVASSLIIIRPDKTCLHSDYFNYLCQSSVVIQQVEGFVKGAGLPRLSIQNLLKVLGVFPLLDEQAMIAEFLDIETTKLDSLNSEAQRGIDLLRERRTTLISAAVTGKIDVRGLVINTDESETAHVG